MGSDKAFLDFHGRTLVEHVLQIARSVTTRVAIVGSSDKLSSYAETISDIFPNCGPLGGIHAALRHTRTDLNLMLAVDTPFIAPDFLLKLVEHARASTALATVPRLEDQFQPLCAVYRPVFAKLAERALQRGQNKIGLLLTPNITETITQDQIEALAFPVSMFDNLNTRDDLERARTRTAQR